jgi:hypothetical protein
MTSFVDFLCHDIFYFKHGYLLPLSVIFRTKANAYFFILSAQSADNYSPQSPQR